MTWIIRHRVAMEFVSTDFDIFASRPIQSSILETTEARYSPIAPVGQSDLEFVIPAENESYIDLNLKLYVRGKLVKTEPDGTHSDLDDKELTCVANNLIHSLFSQCSVTLNGVCITQSKDLYPYRAYLETLLTYGNDAATSHLTNSFWYLDTGDMQVSSPSAAETTTTRNTGFIARWQRATQSKEVELFGRVHSDLFNVPQLLLPGVKLQIRFTKARDSFYIMSKEKEPRATFKIHDAKRVT